jgi:hypothetical protein
MPEIILNLIVQSGLLPFAAAAVVLAVSRAARLHTAGAVVALTAGFLATWFAVLSPQWSPVPKQALDWLPWIAVLALRGAFAIEKLGSSRARIVGRLLLSLAAGGLIVSSALESFGPQKAAIAAVVTGVLVAIVWSVVARPAAANATRPLLLSVVAAGGAVALMLDSSQSLGQLSGGLAAALGACVVFSLPRLRVAFGSAAAGFAVVMLGTLLANAHLYAGFSLGYVALLAGALLAEPVLARIAGARRGQGFAGSWLTAAILTAIPVLVTVALVAKTAQDNGGY